MYKLTALIALLSRKYVIDARSPKKYIAAFTDVACSGCTSLLCEASWSCWYAFIFSTRFALTVVRYVDMVSAVGRVIWIAGFASFTQVSHNECRLCSGLSFATMAGRVPSSFVLNCSADHLIQFVLIENSSSSSWTSRLVNMNLSTGIISSIELIWFRSAESVSGT